MYPKSSPALRAMLAFLLFWVVSAGRAQAADTYKLQWVNSGNTHIPLIQVGFSDGKSRLFMIDTASSTTIMDRNVAAELRLSGIRVYPNDPTNTMEYVVCTANLGPDVLTLQRVPFIVSDLSRIRSLYPDVAGSIGLNVLVGYSLRMDFSKKQLELIPGSVKGTPDEPMDAEKLTLTQSGPYFRVTGSLDKVKVDFVVASGSEYTFVADPEVLQRLTPKAILNDGNILGSAKSGTSSQATTGRFVRLGEFAVGKLQVKDPILLRAAGLYKVNGIGDDILQRFRIVLDFKGQTLYLTPDPAFKETPEMPAANRTP